MTYNRDLQEDKEAVFDSLDQITMTLEVFAGMIREVEIEPKRMLSAASDPGLLATDLADYLVKRGVPFREAHEIIGKLVAFSIEHQRPLAKLTLSEYRQFSDRFMEDVLEALNLDQALRSRTAVGAPSPKNVAAELEAWNARLRD
jgi:argininosuccinate lyase